MVRRGWRTLAMFLLLLVVASRPAVSLRPVEADAGIEVLSTDVRMNFPSGVLFTLEAQSAEAISSVTLIASPANQRFGAYTRSIKPAFSPGARISASYTWPRFGAQLPPGALITYRWRLSGDDGRVMETPEATVRVEDTRFTWRELQDGMLVVRWYRGDDDFGAALLKDTADALQRLAAEQGVDIQRPVTVHVYGDQQDLYSALPGTPPWIGGISIGEFDTVLAPVRSATDAEGRRAVVHELTHQVIYQITFNPSIGSQVPAWLNEGLAVVSEGPRSTDKRRALDQAVSEDTLPTLRALVPGFGRLSGADAQRAYAAGEDVVRFLLREHGAAKMRTLLRSFQDGRTADDALRVTYGQGQDQIEDAWRLSLGLEPRNRGADRSSPTAGTGTGASAPSPSGITEQTERRTLVTAWAGLVGLLLLASVTAAALIIRRAKHAADG